MLIFNNAITHFPKYRTGNVAEELWQIIGLARQDFEQCVEKIKSLDRHSLIRLYWNYLEVQANFLYEPYRIEDYSDGLNDDIGHWVVGQGKEYCNKILDNPKLVPRLEDVDESFRRKRIIDVLHDEYGRRYSKHLPNLEYYPDKFWDIIDLGIENMKQLAETVKEMKREELLDFVHTYEKAMNKFEIHFLRAVSSGKIDTKTLDYSIRDISKWVVAQGREDFWDSYENIFKHHDLPVNLSDPQMAIWDTVARECEKRYYSYPSDKFWELINLAQQNFELFCKKIKQVDREQLICFHKELKEAGRVFLAKAYALYYMSPDFSEFDFDVMGKWVISQGREYYAKVVAHPRLIPQRKIDHSDPNAALMLDIIDAILDEYSERHIEAIPD